MDPEIVGELGGCVVNDWGLRKPEFRCLCVPRSRPDNLPRSSLSPPSWVFVNRESLCRGHSCGQCPSRQNHTSRVIYPSLCNTPLSGNIPRQTSSASLKRSQAAFILTLSRTTESSVFFSQFTTTCGYRTGRRHLPGMMPRVYTSGFLETCGLNSFGPMSFVRRAQTHNSEVCVL